MVGDSLHDDLFAVAVVSGEKGHDRVPAGRDPSWELATQVGHPHEILHLLDNGDIADVVQDPFPSYTVSPPFPLNFFDRLAFS